ncbi:fructose-1,6-bisphosphatase [Algimonas ampicilliniresistens]|uniref:Fructose-1,6-bisphosphatase n=1 Tax=Algimonas ampicilliniresistens TaxID=1298735 RepID=A0ABQ5V970_9PROT|nr:class II fructose-bisphosphatase [Algimonas ampicilliniresistens]GLQ23294.1 fructose-1,6-bisphosphatase [Algimonas ampicilliniresistens]
MGKIGFNAGLAVQAALVTEQAAIAASEMIGRGREKAADQKAVDAMRRGLNALDIRGRIVIGEGERDEAPMLYIGEEVGTGKGPEIDIALDPLEGTTLTAKAMANALAVMAFAPRGGLLFAPDVYMDKIAIGPGYDAGTINLADSPADNVKRLAKAKGVTPSDITVCVLDRSRHSDIIDSLRDIDARVRLITDGDVQGVISTTDPDTQTDMYIGQGGAPEGVLAAAALRCIGGQMQGRLHFRNDDEVARARRVGIDDLDKTYDLEGLASGPTIFSATGVTQGSLLDGVKIMGGRVHTHTLIMNSVDSAVQRLRSSRPYNPGKAG